MKVLMVHKTRIGGVSAHVSDLKKELIKQKFKVDEVSRVEDLGFGGFLSSYFKMKKFFRKMSSKYNVIHVHDWSLAYPAIKSGIKNLVCTFHGFPTHFIAKIFQNYCIKKLDSRAVVVSLKMVVNGANYIPNGVDLNLFKASKKFRRDMNLVGVAQKYNLSEIKKVVKSLGFKFVVANTIPHDKMPEFYSKIGIFVSIPPECTGFNLVWIEAMACGVPHVIGDSSGVGYQLPIHKVDNFDDLGKLLSNIKKLTPLGNQRKWIEKNQMTWKDHVKKLKLVYGSL